MYLMPNFVGDSVYWSARFVFAQHKLEGRKSPLTRDFTTDQAILLSLDRLELSLFKFAIDRQSVTHIYQRFAQRIRSSITLSKSTEAGKFVNFSHE